MAYLLVWGREAINVPAKIRASAAIAITQSACFAAAYVMLPAFDDTVGGAQGSFIPLLGFATVCVACSVAMTWVLFDRHDRRVKALSADAERILNGDLAERAGSDGQDTVARIGEALRSLAKQRDNALSLVQRQTFTDALTGLLNRQGLRAALQSMNEAGDPITVLFIDLNRFKLINDTRGHGAGDTVLSSIATRLTKCAGEAAAIARIGGDEFVVVVAQPPNAPDTKVLAEKLLAQVRLPVNHNKNALRVGASIGIASLPAGPHPKDAVHRILADADIALLDRRATGHGEVFSFDEADRIAREAEANLEQEIAASLTRSEFVPYIQPQVDFLSRRVIGSEILARWIHPEHGIMSASTFLEGLRNPELTVAVDAQVRQKMLAWMANDATPRPDTVSINLTAAQLTRADAVMSLGQELDSANLAPERVVIEVHENVILDAAGVVEENLKAFVARGHQLELDDFGTGNASLQNLMQINVHMLKIDRSFVTGIDQNLNRQSIVSAVVGMGKALGVSVLAEGVETQEECDKLVELGCTLFQGYLFARPMPLDDFGKWHEQWTKTQNAKSA